MAKLNILGGTGEGRSLNINASRSINLYPEIDPDPESKATISLIGTPGLIPKYVVGSGPIRMIHPFNGQNCIVSGSEFWVVDSTGNSTQVGNLQTSDGYISSSDNGILANGIGGNQLIIVDGIAGYIYNAVTGVFSVIDHSGGFPPHPSHVTYADGYFIVTNGTMNSEASNIYDGLTWNALATTPVQANPDNIQCPATLNQGLVFIKQRTTEFYYDAAIPTSQGYPFARVQGGVIDYGTSSPSSVIRAAGSLFWLATQKTDTSGVFVGPVMLSGYAPNLIAPPSIVYLMGQWQDIENAFAWSYSDGGHTFVLWTSPGDKQTLGYDVTTQLWHERSSYQDSPYSFNRHCCNAYAYSNGQHLIGD